MSFLRVATLCAAITSLLALAANVVSYSREFRYMLHAEPAAWLGVAVYPLHLLALTAFFTALFVRQKG
jgi:hypothetical protein